jgi:thymidine kinase
MVLGDEESDRHFLAKVRGGNGFLIHFGDIMSSLKTTSAITTLHWLTNRKDPWIIAKAFSPDSSLRDTIDPNPNTLQSRAGVSLHRVPIPPKHPDLILQYMKDENYKIAVIDECHFFAGEGMALRPVVVSLLDNNYGVITISLNKDFGGRYIAIHDWLFGRATALGRSRKPRCEEPGCWDIATESQLLYEGKPKLYKGFEAIKGDIEDEYSVKCPRHFVSPPVIGGLEERLPGPILLRREEVDIIAALKDKDLLPHEAKEEYFL